MTRFETVPMERVREYWDQRPCNIRHSPSPVGTRQYFDEVEARKYFVEPHIPLFADFARWRDKRVLEIGCGIGTDTINFAHAGALVTAVDVSSKSVELAQRRAEVYGLADRVRFYVADAETLSTVVPPEPYDLVYSFGVIHHTPHPARVIQEVRRHYVHPDTVLKVMVYHRYAWKVLAIVVGAGRGAFWRTEELVARDSEAQTGCPVTYTYTRRDARRLLAPGFQVTDMRVEHIFPYRVKDYIQYRYVKEWHFRWMPPSAFHWLERRLGWHLCLTARVA